MTRSLRAASREPALRARAGADAAAQAETRLRRRALPAGVGGVASRLEPQRPDRAGLHALAAAVAGRGVQPTTKFVVWTGCRKPKRCAASMASQQQPQQLHMKAGLSRTFSPNWTRPRSWASVQELQALGSGDLPGVAVLRERSRGGAEGEADVAGRIAGPPHVLHLVPAVAEADGDRGRLPDHVARPLVVEHLQRELGGQGPLLHERAAELRLPAHEEVLDEVLLDVEVLEVELGQPLLVDVPPDPHHRELEEAGHGGREDVERLAVAARGRAGWRERRARRAPRRLGERQPPRLRRRRGAEGLDGKPRDELRLPRAEEDLEDAEEELRGRRALREAVQPVLQAAVGVPRTKVAHGIDATLERGPWHDPFGPAGSGLRPGGRRSLPVYGGPWVFLGGRFVVDDARIGSTLLPGASP